MKLWTTVGGALLSGALGLTMLAAPAQSDPAAPARARAYAPTLKASTNQVVVKHKLELSGRVRPATRGGTVIIQKRIGDRKWSEETRTTMNGRGRFSYLDRPTTPGPRRYRAVVPAHGRHAKGVSDPVTVTVYRWVDLTTLRTRASDATIHPTEGAEIDGVTYSPAWVGARWAQDGFVDWNLDRACLTLRARYGNSDESDATATANISVVTAGDAIYTGSFGLTESERKVLDISGAFRVGFEWTSSNTAGTPEDQRGAAAVMAEPEALCAF
jgi:hypothetical protein